MLAQKKTHQTKIFEAAVLARKKKTFRRRLPEGERDRSVGVAFTLWAFFLLACSYILFLSPLLMIQEISVEGTSIISTAEYRAFVETEMSGTYLGWFSKRNYFFFPSKKIQEQMSVRFPLLAGIIVERHFPDRVTFHLTENDSLLKWCSGGPCYGIRNHRSVLMPFADDDRYVPVQLSVIDESAVPVSVGDILPVESYLEILRTFHDQLPRFVSTTIQNVATTPSRYSHELLLTTGEGWRLLVSVKRPPEETLGMLRAFLEEYQTSGKDRSALVSVDLRVEGRMFYVENNTAVPDVTSLGDTEKPTLIPEKKKRKH